MKTGLRVFRVRPRLFMTHLVAFSATMPRRSQAAHPEAPESTGNKRKFLIDDCYKPGLCYGVDREYWFGTILKLSFKELANGF